MTERYSQQMQSAWGKADYFNRQCPQGTKLNMTYNGELESVVVIDSAFAITPKFVSCNVVREFKPTRIFQVQIDDLTREDGSQW